MPPKTKKTIKRAFVKVKEDPKEEKTKKTRRAIKRTPSKKDPQEEVQSDVESEKTASEIESPQPNADEPQPDVEEPLPGYLSDDQLRAGVIALKDYVKTSRALKLSCAQKKDLLDSGETRVFVEVVFKNIPSNSRTYIHNVVLPNHWRLELEPEDYDIAVFVKHLQPKTEAEKIQFSRDRDLDMDNTHNYYKDLFDEKLDKSISSRISRIITSKEIATEFNTFHKLDRLAKGYDLFLSDKELMINKMDPLPRRLGRRFWVREKKVPLLVRFTSKKLNENFEKALSTEPFYVVGRSATEQIRIGLMSQSDDDLVENMAAFLKKLYELYGHDVRYIRLRTDRSIALPLFADLSVKCPKVTMRKKKEKPEPVTDTFDMIDDDAKISVYPDGTVKVLESKRKRSPEKPLVKTKKLKKS